MTIYGIVRGSGKAHPAYKEGDKIELCCTCPNTSNGRIKVSAFIPRATSNCHPGNFTVSIWKDKNRID